MERDPIAGPEPLGVGAGVVCAGTGGAGVVGVLSVPPGWVMAAPNTEAAPDSAPAVAGLEVAATLAAPPARVLKFQRGLRAMLGSPGATIDAANSDSGSGDTTAVVEGRVEGCGQPGAGTNVVVGLWWKGEGGK